MAPSGQNPEQNVPAAGAGMYGYPTPEEAERSIRLAVDPLRDMGLSPEQFTYQTVLAAGFLSTDFVKAAGQLGTLSQQGVIDDILSSAIHSGACGMPSTWGPRELATFLKWTKGLAGASALQSINRKQKLGARARARPTQTVADGTFPQLLQAQIADLSRARMLIRQDYEGRIRDLKKKIAELEKQLEEELAGVDAAFFPASEYVEPEFADLSPTAYRLYSEAAARAGKSCLPLSDEGYMEAMRLHGQDARNAVLKKWLASQGRRDGLIAFCREKIASSDSSQQAAFCNLLALVGNDLTLSGKKRAQGRGS